MYLPTDRQKQVLDYIQSHIDNDGYSKRPIPGVI